MKLFKTISTAVLILSVNVQAKKSIELVEFKDMPLLEGDSQNLKIKLGGFSALKFIKKEKNKIYFKTITDRGPNGAEVETLVDKQKFLARPFLIPTFSPLIVEFYLDTQTKKLTVTQQTALLDFNLQKTNGLPLIGGEAKGEEAVDQQMRKVFNKGIGLDSEGYCETSENYFVSDEYGPFLFKFDKATNKLLKIYKPGAPFPTEWSKRKPNRGLEGLACNEENVYLMLQSPLPKEEFVRLAEFNIKSEKMAKEFQYPVDKEKADKIGDITLISGKKLLVLEQNGKLGQEDSVRALYQVDLAKANDKNELTKELVMDLSKTELNKFEKIEGVSLIDSKNVALIMDNDFAVENDLNLKENKIAFRVKDVSSQLILLKLSKKLH